MTILLIFTCITIYPVTPYFMGGVVPPPPFSHWSFIFHVCQLENINVCSFYEIYHLTCKFWKFVILGSLTFIITRKTNSNNQFQLSLGYTIRFIYRMFFTATWQFQLIIMIYFASLNQLILIFLQFVYPSDISFEKCFFFDKPFLHYYKQFNRLFGKICGLCIIVPEIPKLTVYTVQKNTDHGPTSKCPLDCKRLWGYAVVK